MQINDRAFKEKMTGSKIAHSTHISLGCTVGESCSKDMFYFLHKRLRTQIKSVDGVHRYLQLSKTHMFLSKDRQLSLKGSIHRL